METWQSILRLPVWKNSILKTFLVPCVFFPWKQTFRLKVLLFLGLSSVVKYAQVLSNYMNFVFIIAVFLQQRKLNVVPVALHIKISHNMFFCIEVRSYSVMELQLSSFLCIFMPILEAFASWCVCFRQW